MRIIIFEPRWHDEVVLVADHKIKEDNEIVITYKRADGTRQFPSPFYITGDNARKYPLEQLKTKAGGILNVRAIKLTELEREEIDV